MSSVEKLYIPAVSLVWDAIQHLAQEPSLSSELAVSARYLRRGLDAWRPPCSGSAAAAAAAAKSGLLQTGSVQIAVPSSWYPASAILSQQLVCHTVPYVIV